jgi:3-oxoacyl-[acyl-carrier protein] reductase
MTKKIAIITGAGSGIGKAVALDLAKQGYHIALVGRTKTKLETVHNEIKSIGGAASVYPLDVADAAAISGFVTQIAQQFSRIDVLFNNAGIGGLGTADITIDRLNKIIQTNLLGAIYMANAVSKIMRKAGRGYIINLSSIWGTQTMSYVGAYVASKHGLVGFSKCLQQELIAHGVQITALCPACVSVGMGDNRSYSDQMIPIEDVVKAVNFLLSLNKNTAIPVLEIDCSLRIKIENDGYKPYYENLDLG